MKSYRDQELSTIQDLVQEVITENERQVLKWGVQIHTLFEWLAYLTEEVGELSEAISEKEYRMGRKEDAIKESIQVATLALKIAEMLHEQE